MRPSCVRAVLLSVCLSLLPTMTVAADLPDWLQERTERLMSTRTSDPAHVDSLLALSTELAAHGDNNQAARCMEVAGIQAFYTAELSRALEIWTTGLGFAREHGELAREGGFLNALAIGYTEDEQLDKALLTHEQSLGLKTALGDSLGISRTWGNISLLYRQMGRVAESLDAATEAERWNALTGNVAGDISVMVGRAAIYNRLGRYHEAVQMAEAALAGLETTPVPYARGLALLYRGKAHLSLGEHESALADIDDAITALEAENADYYLGFAFQWRTALLIQLGRLDEADASLEVFQQTLNDAEVPRLRTVQFLFEGQLALEEGRHTDALGALDQAMVTFEERRNERQDLASRDGLFGNTGEIYGVISHTHLALGDTLQAWQATERGQALGFRERLGAGGVAADLAAVQAALAEADAVLVQACETRTRPLVWFVITPTALTVVEAGDEAAMVGSARLALSQLASGQPLEQAEPFLAPLGDDLLGPLAPWLEDPPSRLYVVVPSLLTGLPLAVLPLPDGGRLGDRVAVSYVPSAGSLTLLMARESTGEGLLALGDPELGDPAALAGLLPSDPMVVMADTPLPEAAREVRRIAGRHGQVYLGAEARLSTLLAEGPGAAVVHVASHAVSDPVDGSRSALVLASDVVADGPAVLTAAAAETLSLRADLTVLSACRSGLGHALLGEGGVGLPRSLMIAGSRSVVSSLWDVEDGATRRFMEAFYGELRRGMARDEALRQAADELRRQGVPPRDWAAFVLSGVGHEPVTSLASETRPWLNPPLIWFGGSVVMVAIIAAFNRRRFTAPDRG